MELVGEGGQPTGQARSADQSSVATGRGGKVHPIWGRTGLYLKLMHAEVGLIKTMVANVQAAIAYAKRSAQQVPKIDRWRVLLCYICERITQQTILTQPPLPLPVLAVVG